MRSSAEVEVGVDETETRPTKAYETVFVPTHDDWASRVEAIRGSEKGRRASEDQARRAEEFERLIERFEKESASVCELCGAEGALSSTVAR